MRVIPFLPGKKMFQKSSRKLAETRLAQIDDYVKSLVLLPENVSRSEMTCRFFRSNWQEDRMKTGEGGGGGGDSVKYTVKQMHSKTELLPADGAAAQQ